MKNTIFILFIVLIVQSCTSVTEETKGGSGSTTTSEFNYDYNHRWIDNSNVMNLINFSSEKDIISHADIYENLGEPVYVEKLYISDKDDVSKNTILFWYKYKSRLYPIAEQETVTTKDTFTDAMGNVQVAVKEDISDYSQIKPVLAEDYNQWEEEHKWLVVVMFDDTYELILSDALGTYYGFYRDVYKLDEAGHFEAVDNMSLLEQMEIVLEKIISKLNSK